MAEVALSLLAAVGFCPDFTAEPRWLTCLEGAMRLVNRDVAATGIDRPCRLRVYDELTRSGNAYVETGDGHTGPSGGIYPASGADPVSVLVAVADDAQDALMEELWRRGRCAPSTGLLRRPRGPGNLHRAARRREIAPSPQCGIDVQQPHRPGYPFKTQI
jgi:hypothetical protein